MRLILAKMMTQNVMLKLRAIVRHITVNHSSELEPLELRVPLVVLA
jgi:hypothetical protein